MFSFHSPGSGGSGNELWSCESSDRNSSRWCCFSSSHWPGHKEREDPILCFLLSAGLFGTFPATSHSVSEILAMNEMLENVELKYNMLTLMVEWNSWSVLGAEEISYLPGGHCAQDIDDTVGLLLSLLGIFLAKQTTAAHWRKKLCYHLFANICHLCHAHVLTGNTDSLWELTIFAVIGWRKNM